MERTDGPAPLVDPHGRTVRDLRVSVTDRCDLRCTYCMPAGGLDWTPRDDLLRFDEIERVVALCVSRFGFTSVRLTGGEPTVRAGLPDLVGRLARLGVDTALTTNGVTLARWAGPLAAAGLGRINVSLDTLRADRFVAITRRDGLGAVLAGIDAALSAGLAPVKLNCVLERGVNDDEVLDLAGFGRDLGIEVRFIEWMPLDGEHRWSGDRVVPAAEVVSRISARWPLVRVARGSSPAEAWDYADGGGRVGVIGSVTEPFCASCDRVRLTADGKLRNCLFSVRETDLRALLRGGADDDRLAAAVEAEVGRKWAGHAIGKVEWVRPGRSMSQIGG